MTELQAKIDLLVDRYLSSIGVVEYKNHEDFLLNINKKYGLKVQSELALASRDESGKLYSIKNNELDLSLDFAGFSYDVYKQFLSWMVASEYLGEKTILDLGCDNGIITCFLGLVYPNSKIVGVDKNSKGLKCARELAKRLNLKNVQFEEADGKKLDKVFKKKKFDVIISVRSMLEMVQLPKMKHDWTLEGRINSINVPNSLIKVLKSFRKLMDFEGKIITFEKLDGFEDIVNFAKSMHASELYFEKDKFLAIQFHELGQYQEMPIMIFDRKKKNELTLDEFIDLYSNSDIINRQIDTEATISFGNMLQFERLEDKELLYGVQMQNPSVGRQREELWRSGDKFIFYRNNSYGHTDVITEGITVDKVEEMKEGLTSMKSVGFKVFEYETIEERDNRK